MEKSNTRYFVFLILILILSIPFYIWGAFFPVEGLPFGLPISFLMIFVPFILSVIYAWREGGKKGTTRLFQSILDIKKAESWAIIFSITCLPLVAVFSYFTMKLLQFPLPGEVVIPYNEIPLMLVLYFLGAIPEELGWTYTLTGPLTEAYGPNKTGFIIGSVWAMWHVIPWSWAYPAWWIIGMCVLNVLMRTAMVYAYIYGGRSVFTGLVFHTMINVSMGLFPNNGSHMNTWIFSLWMAVLLLLIVYYIRRKKGLSGGKPVKDYP